MKYLKTYNESIADDDIKKVTDDISLEVLDKGISVDISWTPWSNDNLDCDILMWKHNGNERHIPFEFDQDCIDFSIRINDYMISNGLHLVRLTIVIGEEFTNKRFTDMEKAIKFLCFDGLLLNSSATVEEVYFHFSNHHLPNFVKPLKHYLD